MDQSVTFSRIFKVRPDKVARVRAWMQELSSARQSEALETLAQENLSRETYALFVDDENTHYLIGMTIGAGRQLPANQELEINQQHSTFKKECLVAFSKTGEILLDLKVPPPPSLK